MDHLSYMDTDGANLGYMHDVDGISSDGGYLKSGPNVPDYMATDPAPQYLETSTAPSLQSLQASMSRQGRQTNILPSVRLNTRINSEPDISSSQPTASMRRRSVSSRRTPSRTVQDKYFEVGPEDTGYIGDSPQNYLSTVSGDEPGTYTERSDVDSDYFVTDVDSTAKDSFPDIQSNTRARMPTIKSDVSGRPSMRGPYTSRKDSRKDLTGGYSEPTYSGVRSVRQYGSQEAGPYAEPSKLDSRMSTVRHNSQQRGLSGQIPADPTEYLLTAQSGTKRIPSAPTPANPPREYFEVNDDPSLSLDPPNKRDPLRQASRPRPQESPYSELPPFELSASSRRGPSLGSRPNTTAQRKGQDLSTEEKLHILNQTSEAQSPKEEYLTEARFETGQSPYVSSRRTITSGPSSRTKTPVPQSAKFPSFSAPDPTPSRRDPAQGFTEMSPGMSTGMSTGSGRRNTPSSMKGQAMMSPASISKVSAASHNVTNPVTIRRRSILRQPSRSITEPSHNPTQRKRVTMDTLRNTTKKYMVNDPVFPEIIPSQIIPQNTKQNTTQQETTKQDTTQQETIKQETTNQDTRANVAIIQTQIAQVVTTIRELMRTYQLNIQRREPLRSVLSPTERQAELNTIQTQRQAIHNKLATMITLTAM